MHACMHACMYVCMYACMHVSTPAAHPPSPHRTTAHLHPTDARHYHRPPRPAQAWPRRERAPARRSPQAQPLSCWSKGRLAASGMPAQALHVSQRRTWGAERASACALVTLDASVCPSWWDSHLSGFSLSFLSPSLGLGLSLCLSVASLSLFSLPLSVSVCLCVCLWLLSLFSLSLCLGLGLCLCLCVCLCVYVRARE